MMSLNLFFIFSFGKPTQEVWLLKDLLPSRFAASEEGEAELSANDPQAQRRGSKGSH
jgi:hypothetical protein